MRQQLRETTEETQQYKSAPPTTTTTQEVVTVTATQPTQAAKTKTTTLERSRYSALDLNIATAFALILGGIIGMIVGGIQWSHLKDLPWIFFGAIFAFTGVVIGVYFNKRTADDKLELDKLNADKKELQDQFADIQNRFAAKEEIMRANAALRLGEFALLPLPRTDADKRDNIDFPVNATNYPYYLRAASQLATALHMEKDDDVRRNIVEALGLMAAWDKLPDDNTLRTELIRKVAEANRIAKDKFIRAFAVWSTVSTEWENYEASERNKPDRATYIAGIEADYETTVMDAEKAWEETITDLEEAKTAAFKLPISLTLFCDASDKTLTGLQSLIAETATGSEEAKFAIAQTVHHDRRKAMTASEENADNALRPSLMDISAKILIDARDALAIGLTQLKPPYPFGKEYALHSKNRFRVTRKLCRLLPEWKREPSLNLSTTFLAGANLENAELQGVSFVEAHLQGANLEGANLQRVEFREAYLQETLFGGAQLQYADFFRANLSKAELGGAELYWVNFGEAELADAVFTSASFGRTRVDGSNISEAIGVTKIIKRRFRFDYFNGEIDHTLKRWFASASRRDKTL